ncbi:MAG: hypothetical protein ACM3TR_16350 [Caulobacteraceae bacterium]
MRGIHFPYSIELMKLLVKSGLSGVCIGIESGNEFDLKLYGKITTVDDNVKSVVTLEECIQTAGDSL